VADTIQQVGLDHHDPRPRPRGKPVAFNPSPPGDSTSSAINGAFHSTHSRAARVVRAGGGQVGASFSVTAVVRCSYGPPRNGESTPILPPAPSNRAPRARQPSKSCDKHAIDRDAHGPASIHNMDLRPWGLGGKHSRGQQDGSASPSIRPSPPHLIRRPNCRANTATFLFRCRHRRRRNPSALLSRVTPHQTAVIHSGWSIPGSHCFPISVPPCAAFEERDRHAAVPQ